MAAADARAVPPVAKLVVGLVALGLVVMLAEAMVYRLDHPSIVVDTSARMPGASGMSGANAPGGQGMPPGMSSEEGGEVSRLMAAMAENPDDPGPLRDLAEHFLASGDWAKARVFADRALAAAPSDTRALYFSAVARANAGQYQDAAKRLGMLLDLEPDNALANLNLGILQKRYLGQADKGDAHLRKALQSPAATEAMKERARSELEAEPGAGAGDAEGDGHGS